MKKLQYIVGFIILLLFFYFTDSLMAQTKYKVEYDIEQSNPIDWEDGDSSEVIISLGSTATTEIYRVKVSGGDYSRLVYDDVVTLLNHDPENPETEISFYKLSSCPTADSYFPVEVTGSFTHCRDHLTFGIPGQGTYSQLPESGFIVYYDCVVFLDHYSRIVQLSESLIVPDNYEINDCDPFTIKVAECEDIQLTYALEYSYTDSMGNIINGELSAYSLKSASLTFNLTDIPGIDPSMDTPIVKTRARYVADVRSSDNSHFSEWVSLDIKACSPELQNTIKTDATCNGAADGSVTLEFDRNVDSSVGYEMRYFIFQGSPPINATVDQLKTDPPVFPNQSFKDPLGITLMPLNDGSGYYTGTFEGLEGSSTIDNGNTVLNYAEYYIIYQEVRYDFPNQGDVDVKSGGITPKFTIESPSPIIPFGSIIAPQFCGDTAEISFAATGGDNLDSSGIYKFQYRLNGGEWLSNELNPQPIELGAIAQNVEVKAFYSVENCESDPVPLNGQIPATPPSLSFENPNPGIASSNNSNDGVISINYDGGTPNYTFELAKENETTLEFETITNPKLIHNSLNQTVEFQELGIGTYKITITDSNGCNLTSENILVTTIPPPQIVDQQVNQILCPNGNDGSITLTISGGVLNYNYQWTINGAMSPIQTTGNQTISLNNLSEPGEYILKVASAGFTEFDDPSGYESTTITLNTPEEVIINSATPNNISCLGAQDGSISVMASGGSSYEYKLDFFDTWTPLNNGTIPITSGGFYDIYLRNQNNCEADPVIGVLVSEPDEITVSSTSENTTTNGGNQGGIMLNIAGGTPFSPTAEAYAISWAKDGQPFTPPNGSTSSNLINLEAGEYIAQITDANGCSPLSNLPIVIDQPGPLGISSLTPSSVLCKGEATGGITAAVTGVAPFNYIWERQDGQSIISPNTPTIANLTEGIYILRLTDASGDPEVTDTVTVTEPLETFDAIVVPTVASCYGGNDGSIQITVLGGTAPYEYAIDDGFGFQVGDTFNDLAPRTYVVIVRDNNLCEFTTIVEIIEPLQISVTESISNVTSTGGSDGSINLEVLGGTEPYAYSWTGPGITIPRTTKDIDVLVTGNYTVEITSPGNQGGIDGCYFAQTFFVPEPGPLSINNITTTDVNCFGEATGSITTMVTGEGTIVYEWTFANGSPIPISNGTDGPDITGIDAGSYMLTVTDNNTTTSSPPIAINQPSAPLNITNIFTTNVSCFGGSDGSVQIEAFGGTGAYTYSLDGINYQNSPFFNGLAQGSIAVYVRDSNNCDFISPNPVIINEPQELSFVIDLQQPLSAANVSDGAISISASGGTGSLGYSWTGPNGFTSTNEDIIDLEAGDYILTITDDNYALNNDLGCLLVSSPITIAEPGTLLVDLVQTVMLECNGDDFGEIMATVQGGVPPYSYEWFQVTNGNSILEEDTKIIGNLSTGEYFVRVTDANSISRESLPISITQPGVLDITVVELTGGLCNGGATGAIEVTVSGGTGPYSYLWSNGSITQNLIDLEPGEYNLEVFDDNGCFEETTVTINPAPDPVHIADATVSNVSQYMANDGKITLQIEGGATPYAMNWIRLSDNKEMGNTQEITNLTAGSYQVYISDNNGCNLTAIYDITQPDIVEEIITQPSCYGENNGSIEIVVNQGNGTFSYSWNTGASTNNITNLAPGNYTVNINGFGNGTLTRTYVIEEPIPLEVNLGEDRTLCKGQVLVLNATADNSNATYNWTSDNGFSSSDPSVTINDSGNYSVVVKNQNGCMAMDTIFVDVTDDEINAEFAVSSQVFVGESLIAVDISYPLPETQEWILPEGATILKQDSDEAEMVFNAPGEYGIGIITQIGECFAKQTKKVLVTENEVLTSGDGQADPRKLIEDFIIYPNPTDGKFTADIVLSERGNISIKIFNFANNALMASKKDRGASSYLIPFDISGLPSGVYAVLLETAYGNSLRKIILK
ncbi:T9SS type A sorting domain-containing protein [Arenibacter sp. F26102]|uniref:T9SS type A sorting domain-containing protein n=1 Tax=Arenibacter sp. F26102 TaxID=2926416 RepID=UPI001FF2CA8C|nr:T9SS type A sorting domain-containing protein [Arenibacter sp. F26102]MCK0147429.1 T9SS type A sorting domain-containing protein [Arenibacter sp. F26102]